jgi:hypothetical protein
MPDCLTSELTDNIFIGKTSCMQLKTRKETRMCPHFHCWIIALLLAAEPNYAMSKRPQEKEKPDEGSSNAVSMIEKKPIEGSGTFLDTLNKGKEIALSDYDLKPILPESTTILGDGSGKGLGAATEGFRIQCFASSQIERIRSEQKELETKIKFPIYIVFNAPYYKLLVGDFFKRADADGALAKLKEIGYGDAWVARSRINPIR